MRRLSSIILLIVLSVSLLAQKSPHGDSFKANCDDCHKTDGWKVDLSKVSFDHSGTKFPLVGQHQSVNCKQCHTSLEFAKAQTECNACHSDVHEQTVGNECARCHTPNSWMVTNITKLHQQSRFPLIGPHRTADCKDCHKNLLSASASAIPPSSRLRFDPMGIECYDCHKANYIATTRPNHKAANYSTNCTDCHNMNSYEWKGAGINHNFFPLTGVHATDDCNKCHKSGVFTGLSHECVSCHQADYASASNPNHASLNFSTNCKDCHTLSAGWKPADYKDHDAVFPIYSGKHNGQWNTCADCHTNPANYSEYSCTTCHEHSNKTEVDNKHNGLSGYSFNSIACYGCHPTGSGVGKFDHTAAGFPLTNGHASVDCAKCHTSGFVGTSNVCASCHTNNYNQTTNPNHNVSGISNDCAACHTTIPGWKPATYPADHSKLQGAHLPIANDCAACHKGVYSNLPKVCYDCHSANYTQSTNPSHTAAQFATTCADCHSQTAWVPSTFDHSSVYPLTGAHATIAKDCIKCHVKGYVNTPNTCAGCHTTDYNQTTKPNHATSQFPTTCETCHTPSSWVPSTFNHTTVYPLTGAHTTVACNLCHTTGYISTPNTCAGCHTINYNQTTNPNHNASGISNDCASCHTTNPGWKPVIYPADHSKLQGAHIPIANDCAACHKGIYSNSPKVCYDCHSANYTQSTNPSHTAARFATTCSDCHSQTAWVPSTFDHSTVYPLLGVHATIAKNCVQCHANGYPNTPNTCAGCHTTDYNQTTKPNHATSQFPTTCETCHTPSSWVPSTFNHTTVYPITGAHTTVACNLCHTTGYINTPNTCAGCHTTNYNQTTNPNHNASGISTDCASCHTTNPGWKPVTYPADHSKLQGAHVPIANDCAACHKGIYSNSPKVCYDCHSANYTQSTNPSHTASLFPTTCAECHSQTAWVPSTFDHNTVYPLTGAHTTIAKNCILCHAKGYPNTPNTCAGCHTTDYNQTTNPNHTTSLFPTTCETCHTPSSWIPSTFNHTAVYPLTGAHTTVACVLCHKSGYVNTPNTCAGCHTNDFNQTTNPNHTAAKFPTTCETCHTPSAWVPSSFNHTSIYPLIGSHTTVACTLCHTTGYVNTPNTCAGCHTNDFNQTTSPNHTTSLFPKTCETCHTPSAWVPSTFNHTAVYPLTGAHTTVACNLCHANGYPNTPTTCVGCHQNDFNLSANPSHSKIGISTDCKTCHTTNPGWSPATFATHNTYYVLAGAHVSVACVTCHNGNYNTTPNTCAGCHQTKYNQTTSPNHTAAQFSNSCATCHSQSAWVPSTWSHTTYFPISSGNHKQTCATCHTNAANYAVFTCITSACHATAHNRNQGSAGCYSCHPTGRGG